MNFWTSQRTSELRNEVRNITVKSYLKSTVTKQPETPQTWRKLWSLPAWCKLVIKLHQTFWLHQAASSSLSSSGCIQWRTLGGGGGGLVLKSFSLELKLFKRSFSFEKWKHKKVLILRSGTVVYYLVHYFALLLSWLQQFVRLCVTLCNLVT